MAQRVIVWTETAVFQRREILKYWTIRNGSTKYAEKLIKLIKERLDLIIDNPEACKAAEYPDTREAAMGNFSIYYKFDSERLIVTAFWDNRQDPNKLLVLLTS